MNKFQYYIGMARLWLRRFVNKYIRRYSLSEKGEKLVAYLYKVINEDYQPQDYSDMMLENSFNPNKLTGEERKTIAKAIFANLVEFI